MILDNVVSRVRMLSTTFMNVRSLFLPADKMSSAREQFLTMGLEEKRKQYRCQAGFKTLADIPTWHAMASITDVGKAENLYPVNKELNEKISIFTGDITTLEIDAIVNAANKTLLGGGGVDGAIHRAAGRELVEECRTLNGCNTGQAKISGGYRLPAKYVIHTVGPVGEKTEMLQSCYHQCLSLMKEKQLRSIAFPCISTGVYGYPNEPAANVALKTTLEFLQDENNAKNVDRVIFCLFMPVDIEIYKKLLPRYFPTE